MQYQHYVQGGLAIATPFKPTDRMQKNFDSGSKNYTRSPFIHSAKRKRPLLGPYSTL